MKIIISGGHLTPALALIDYLSEEHPQIKIIFVGRKFSQEKNKQLSYESTEIKNRNVKFINFNSTKYVGKNFIAKYISIFKLSISILKALIILNKEKPDLFISFGGYLAVPIAVAAYLKKIPIFTHEQTFTAGKANFLISGLAKKTALSYPETKKYFSKNNTIVTGNFVRPKLFKKYKKPNWLRQTTDLPLLYITGGSQGSKTINNIIKKNLDYLTKNFIVIHQCGANSQKYSPTIELNLEKNSLPKKQKAVYFIKNRISDEDLAWIYQNCDYIISRAGANTITEIISFKIPSLLIPLPKSVNEEQLINAQNLESKKLAVILPQESLSNNEFIKKIDLLTRNKKNYQKNLQNIKFDSKKNIEKFVQLFI